MIDLKINRALFLFYAFFIASLITGCNKENFELPPKSSAITTDGVNILFLFTDDQRWDALSYVGNPVLKTPNIDRLAEQSTYFENAFVTTPICCASRASVLTGQYGNTNGVLDFSTAIDLKTTYPKYLKGAGYYTGFIGKWGTSETNEHYFKEAAKLFDFWAGSMGQGNYWHQRNCNYVNNNGTSDKFNFFCDCPEDARGFKGEEIRIGKDNLLDPVHMETYVIPDKVKKFLDQREVDKPFCLSISFKSPHGPWGDYDNIFDNDYDGMNMPIAASVTERAAIDEPDFLRYSLNGIKNLDVIKDAYNPNGFLQNNMRDYYRLLNGLDYSIEQIIKELKERGLYDNTVIIYYSDNGCFMGEHGFTGKWLMYEESVRVPAFIFDPRNKKDGSIASELVLNIDIAPTILDLAGITIPSKMQGKSLVPLIKGIETNWRKDFFLEHHFKYNSGIEHIERSEAVRNKDWKYIRYIDQSGTEREELYHILNDSLELEDLSDKVTYSKEFNELKQRYSFYKKYFLLKRFVD